MARLSQPAPPASSAAQMQFSQSIVETVADEVGVSPAVLDPPLFEAIDTDALEAVLTSGERRSGPPVTVTFEYAGFTVTVTSDGDVTLE
jgi:hypothetical protein